MTPALDMSGAYRHARRRWIVNAIDGTASFVAGEPECGTLIALDEGDDVLRPAPLFRTWTGTAPSRRPPGPGRATALYS